MSFQLQNVENVQVTPDKLSGFDSPAWTDFKCVKCWENWLKKRKHEEITAHGNTGQNKQG